jgi:hypothetical protein
MQLNSIKLSEAHSDKLKAGAPEKMLTECRNMGFEKHTTVKLLHCSLNSINEDEYTITQRSFENVLALRVDVLRKQLSKFTISKDTDE